MIIVVSPAKTLDYDSILPTAKFTSPNFLQSSSELIKILEKKSHKDIKELMKLSDKLVDLNVQRYKDWSLPFTPENSRPSVFAFKGDVYVGLDAYTFTEKDLDFAQDHLRILSGLYGSLRPLDLMQPYRLEMGTKLKNKKGTNLYKFWGSQIAESLDKDQPKSEEAVLVNLASNEYFSAVDLKSLKARVVTPQFYDWKNGQYKMISFFAKKARGYMASWLIRNKITETKRFIEFDVEGYRYCPERSSEDNPVYIRDEK